MYNLIDFDLGLRIEYRISHLFLPHETNIFLSILKNHAFPDDQRIWNLSSSGIYLAKLGYKVDMDFKQSLINLAESSSLATEIKLWNAVRNLISPTLLMASMSKISCPREKIFSFVILDTYYVRCDFSF